MNEQTKTRHNQPRFQVHYFGTWHVIDTLPLHDDADEYLTQCAVRHVSKPAAVYACNVMNTTTERAVDAEQRAYETLKYDRR